jgi:hypothetical protein
MQDTESSAHNFDINTTSSQIWPTKKINSVPAGRLNDSMKKKFYHNTYSNYENNFRVIHLLVRNLGVLVWKCCH